jgi:hypothetical protein
VKIVVVVKVVVGAKVGAGEKVVVVVPGVNENDF